MTSEKDRLDTLLRALLAESPEYSHISLPATVAEKRELLRALMNVRPPKPLSPELMSLQDEELATQRDEKGVVEPDTIPVSPLNPKLRLWQADITRLAADAIVNAANSQMLGCFVPLHKCIDNAIHSAAGMELREECARIMHEQGHAEPTGEAKITPAYNLPSKWVIHTVGPIVYGPAPTPKECTQLADCYRNCLELAAQKGVRSIAFCCISTGEFRFPNADAADIAVATVTTWLQTHPDTSIDCVIFNVFKETDLHIYEHLLGYQPD